VGQDAREEATLPRCEQLVAEYYTRKEKAMKQKTPRGLAEAWRALGLPRRMPSEHDRPQVTPLPGQKARPLPGQLNLADEITDTERRTP
jgi:hypothetical protein